MDTLDTTRRKVLEDYLLDLCMEVDSPKAVSVLVEVILRSQQSRSVERTASVKTAPEERLAP